MSTDIAWAITRNNSAFMLKKRGVAKPFSTDPLNLTNRHCKRYNGSLHKKAIGVAPTSDNKGFAVVMKRQKNAKKPGKNLAKTDMKAGARTSLSKLKRLMVRQRYRKDLTKAALRRASVVIRSQKPLPARKGVKAAAKKTE